MTPGEQIYNIGMQAKGDWWLIIKKCGLKQFLVQHLIFQNEMTLLVYIYIAN